MILIKNSLNNIKKIQEKFYRGFSTIEVILAAALFIIFATGITGVVLQGINLNRLGVEHTIALQYAAEGLEAARSIRNQAYSNISSVNPTPRGISRVGNVWTFLGDGTNNSTDSGRYTRTIKVESVSRDNTPPSGNIVSSGGTADPDTKKITSSVSWNFTTNRPQSLNLITYLTDWKKALTSPGGILVYGDGTSMPKFRTYNLTSFSAPGNTISGASGVWYMMRTSTTKREAIVGYVTNTGSLQIMCYDGSVWSNEWSVPVGGTGTTRRFDISYETNSGDAIVVYSTNTASTNAVAYRTKSGSTGCGSANWSGATNFATSPSVTTGTVQWVRLARDARTSANNITAIWADSNGDLGVNNWSGTAWATGAGTYKVLETSLEFVTAAQDVDNFEVVYESVSGDVMVVWGNSAGANGTNGARYSVCTGGVYSCTWTAVASVPTVSDDIATIDMSSNPVTNQIVYAAIGAAGNDLTAAYWNGSAWTGYANLDTTTEHPFAGSKLVSTSWLINGATTRWILNYDDATGTALGWYSATPGSAPAKQTDVSGITPAINDIRERYDADTDPSDPTHALVTLSDSTKAIFAKKVAMSSTGIFTWTNEDGGASFGTLPVVPQQGFTFFYWRNP